MISPFDFRVDGQLSVTRAFGDLSLKTKVYYN